VLDLHFGPAGWHYDDWRGRVYPERRPRGFHPLPFLSRCVNLVDVNATFYAPLSARTAERWVGLLDDAPGFTFVIKAWERLTHGKGDLPSGVEMQEWSQVLVPLREAGRLLAVLVQFPFSARPDGRTRDRILTIRDRLGGGAIACEFRHESWLRAETLAFLEEEGLSFVNIDQPQGRGSLPPTAIRTAPLAYVRLHGRNAAAWFDRDAGRDARYDYHYGEAELAEWTGRLELLAAREGPLVLVGNNHYHGKGLAAVLALAHRLTGEKLPVPGRMLENFPELAPVHRPDRGELF